MSANTLAVIAATAGAWGIYKITQVGQREDYLPPGPPTVPLLGNLHIYPKALAHYQFTEWAKQYGDIYSLKVGPGTAVVLTSHTAVRELMDKNSAVTSDRPAFHMIDVAMDGHMIILARYTEYWKKTRRASHEPLSSQACNGHLPIQHAEATQFMHELLTHPEDFYTSIRRFSSSVGLSVLFGKRAPQYTTHEVTAFFEVQQILQHLVAPGAHPPIDLIPILQKVPERYASWKTICKELRARQRVLYFGLLEEVEKRIAKGEGNGCFVESLCQRAEEMCMDRDTIAYLAGVIFDAGSDTTAGALQSLVLCLVAFPDVQKKAREEIDRVVGPDRAPTFEDLAHLPYVHAVIKETHRFRPVAPLSIPHATTEDVMYKGYRIPAGTTIFQNTWGIYHDEKLYENESVFNPDRFLKNPFGVREEVLNDNKDWKDDLIYGSGRRFCPGVHLAKNSLAINAANLLWGFNFGKAKDPQTGLEVDADIWDYSNGVATTPNPFKCTITPRSSHHAEIIEQQFANATSTFELFEHDLSEEDRAFVAEQRKGH